VPDIAVRDPVGVPHSVSRLRLALICLALTVLVFLQSPGAEAADTKLDLVVSPGRFLRHAVTMWDPVAGGGQLQDQAYGYLFPMGPFFLLGKLAAVSPWVLQRAWESLVLVTAFLGIVRLSRLLGVAGFWPRVAAGLSYAMAPRMVMELGVISSELLPVALLPWMLIPLVKASSTGSPRRAAALSGLALLCVGGINASATLAVLPVPALWLLTRSAGPRRRALASWWLIAVMLASLWWTVPLLLLGKYSQPFLDWIESSTTTTSVTDLLDVLRGSDHWLAFLGPSIWPGGWIYVAAPAVVFATAAVAAVGLAGLAGRRTPYRLFLVSCLVVGLVLTTLGHVATVGPAYATSIRALLDGGLNAFRNVHKFDPVLRLPLAIGVGHALAALGAGLPRRAPLSRRRESGTVYPQLLACIAVLALAAVAVTPVLAGRVIPKTRTVNEPTWWVQAADWLAGHAQGGRALVVPGAAEPMYLWGAATDDAMQPVAASPWAVRNNLPLSQPGFVRLLDTVESLLAAGDAEPVLAPLLARAGIRYLVVRNDLDTTASTATPLRFVHATIANSPDWTQAAQFGPNLTPVNDPNRLVDLGLSQPDGAVDIYQNKAWNGGTAELLPTANAVVSNGSTDSLPALLGAGLNLDTAVLSEADATVLHQAGLPTSGVLTDGIPRREFELGRVDAYSPIMTASQPYQQTRAAHDFLPPHAGPLSTFSYRGISAVRASSSGSDLGLFYTSTADAPWSAVDGSGGTAWRSAPLAGAVGQWLELDFPAPVMVSQGELGFAPYLDGYPSRIRVSTDAGSQDEDVAANSAVQTIRAVAGSTRHLRITVLAMAEGSSAERVGIGTLRIPGIPISRSLQVPAAGVPDLVSFQVAPGRRAGCLTESGAPACDPSWASTGEEDDALDRTFQLTQAASYTAAGQVRMIAGTALNALLDNGNPLQASASSVDSLDPRERPGAAVDGDPATGWVAAAGDQGATITVRLPQQRLLTGVRLRPMLGAPVTVATRVRVQAGNQQVEATPGPNGDVRFDHPVRVDRFTVTVLASTLRASTDSVTGIARLLPVGIGEIVPEGIGVPAGQMLGTVDLGCASPSPLRVDGRPVPTRLHAPRADVLAGRPVQLQPCDPAGLTLDAGQHQLRLAANSVLAPCSVVLRQRGAQAPAATTTGRLLVRKWSATDRAVMVTTSRSALLVVRENANTGWQATLNGTPLPALTVDGWQQAWLLPAGVVGMVQLRFRPQRVEVAGLVAGGGAVLVLIVLATARSRRRPGPSPLVAATPRPALLEAATVLAMAVLGGLVGIACYLCVRAAHLALARRGLAVPRWLPAALLVASGFAEAVEVSRSSFDVASSWPMQTGQLLAIAALLVAVVTRPRQRPVR
jgi:arabinofuranan 3-O-arabinosyltransferase